MEWRPPVDGDVWLHFSDAECVRVHSERLLLHDYFVALLGPHFSEGLVARQRQTLKLSEEWIWFRHVLHAMYDEDFRLDNVPVKDVRRVLEISDRLGIDPAIKMCLAYVRKDMSSDIFFELAPLLHGCVAIASAQQLRHALFGHAGQRVINAITEDERWNALPLGVREEVLDVLEYQVAQQVKRKYVPRGRVTVAAAMKRCGAIPNDFAQSQNKYAQLDQKLIYERSDQNSAMLVQQDVSSGSPLLATEEPVETTSHLSAPSSNVECLRESTKLSSVVRAVVAPAHEKTTLPWTSWTTTDES